MEKAINDLSQMSDENLFEEISAGIEQIVRGIDRLDGAARSLSIGSNEYPARILGNLAEEEASKILILIDAIRCPLDQREERSRSLRYFYDHLSKGIYAEVCNWGGILTFEEMKQAVNRERTALYLDGPNDVDWIFPNRILQGREDDIYVNYVRDDDTRRYWTSPVGAAENSLFPYHKRTPMVLRIANALFAVGVTSAAGLSVLAETWRPIRMTPDFDINQLREVNRRTLTALDAHGILRAAADNVYRTIAQSWPFPLYSLELRALKVDRGDLKSV